MDILDFKAMLYTWKHKLAFLKLEKELLGRNTIAGYLHDADKLILYALPLKDSTIRRLHRKWSSHHVECKKRNYVQMVIDWECARFTKPDKPLNAYATLLKFYPQEKENILPVLRDLGLIRGGASHDN